VSRDHLLGAHGSVILPLVPVHPFAARGFRDVAEAYERGRPAYPPDAIAWLAQRLALGPGSTAVDLGAGTGKLTRQLLETGAHVIAVEPVESMRRVLAEAVPEVEVLAGSAEAIPLPGASVDAATAGQAAHWFRPDEALPELVRVLRPDGAVGFVWNVHDPDDRLYAAIEELIAPYREQAPWTQWPRFDEALARGPFTALEQRTFEHVHELRADDVPALVASYSYVGGLEPKEREDVLRRVRELVGTDPVRLRYRTEAYAARRA
jgi:SAM-dependent methyltransferase